ncbi:Prephenate dehydrogenase [bacterium HR35]|nr:Prephenate dehydrogenase [bacterium HR35]
MIKSLRKKIDKIDKKIIKFLEKRILLVEKINKVKEKRKLSLTSSRREEEIINNLKRIAQNDFLKENIWEIYSNIFTLSKKQRSFFRFPQLDFKNIGIIGLGIIGGSMAKALKLKDKNLNVFSIKRDDKDIKEALKEKIIDKVYDLKELIFKSDLIVLATPIEHIIPWAYEIKKNLIFDKKLIVIDVGSVKEKIALEFERLTDDKLEFLATHPMAGSDKSGFLFSKATLFINYPWIITPHSKNKKLTINKIKNLVKFLGAKPKLLSPAEHDKIVAKVSHLVFLISALLFAYAYETNKKSLNYSGTGFKTTTRLTSGNPFMHWQIYFNNKKNIDKELKNFIKFLKSSKIDLNFFLKYKILRDKIIKSDF